jgi:hypothetical protein
MDYTKKFTSCFNHTLENGRNFTMCIRCQLAIDADGYPDPEHYSYERYVALCRQRRSGLHCVHQKTHQTVLGAPYELPTTIVIGGGEPWPLIEDGKLYRFEMDSNRLEKFLEGFDKAKQARPKQGGYICSGFVNFLVRLRIKKKFDPFEV